MRLAVTYVCTFLRDAGLLTDTSVLVEAEVAHYVCLRNPKTALLNSFDDASAMVPGNIKR